MARGDLVQHVTASGTLSALVSVDVGSQVSGKISVLNAKLRWSGGDLDGDHLICVVSEQAPEDYLDMLRLMEISCVVAGKSSVDLRKAVDQLGKHFGIRTPLFEGGGHINGAFLQAGLVDELSLLVVPGIDGRHEIPAVFDGLSQSKKKAVPLSLKSIERRKRDTLWLRYKVVRSRRAKT